ncbi:DUF5017 domain-containing protein [Pedobacter heparinus]|uniref:DUF5017 domain-containing protein n=1 Tax=Pedobacter heparinus TaxID=984 RepID=UPI00292F8E6E|nr:DUF5017 domain-containing protein [Pedobacter heparinus]
MKLRYYNLLAGVLLMASCEKELPSVDTPSFEVSTASTSYKVGSVVKFNITGTAGIVSFYSGEPLKDYAFRAGRIVDAGNAGARLSFMSAVNLGTQGTLSATVPPHLKVMASTNFSGNYDMSSIQAATWSDITSRFRYAINNTAITSNPTPPGLPVDISDLIVAGKPIYIAYKYVTLPQGVNGTARTWSITSFQVISNKDISVAGPAINPTITNYPGAGFRLVDQNPVTAPARSSLTTTTINLLGNLYDAVNDAGNDPLSENWAISKPIFTNTIDLGPDKAVAIKDQAKATALIDHTYIYTQPGTYKATFVALNANLHDSKEIVKEITITITP